MSDDTTVLLGTDGSCFRAVDRAAEAARGSGAARFLACAYRPMPARPMPARPMPARDAQDAQDALGGESSKVAGPTLAEEVLRDAAHRARSTGAVDVETLAIEGGPVDEPIRLAERRQVDLVVVGNRGLNSLASRLLGSVPANLSRRATCDVLVAHSTGRTRT